MNDLERRKFELHAETEDYHERVELAVGWIHDIFDYFENPCLNYSGGKDSLALLHLVTQRCGYDDVEVFHFDNGLLDIPDVDEFVRASVERLGGLLITTTSKKANSDQMITEQGHGYNGFWGQYSWHADRQGWDIRLLGIRAAESRERRDRFETDDETAPINWHEQYTSTAPIHQFTTRDVWAYIVANELDYHHIYDKQGDLYGSMEARGNRLVTLYDSEFDSLGAREISQFIYPGETNELKDIEQRNQ